MNSTLVKPAVVLVALLSFGQSCTCNQENLLESVPQSESWKIPQLSSAVHVLRTEMNIPHIYADNLEDLYRVQGFVMARDRYVQFELGRRFGQGTVAELLGEIGLSIDQQSRGRGMSFVADRLWNFSTQKQRKNLEAFAQGINAFIGEVQAGNLPIPSELEFIAPFLGIESPEQLMQEVSGEDIMSMAAVIVSQLGYETTDVLRSQIESQIENHFSNSPLSELRQEGIWNDLWLPVGPIRKNTSALGWGLETAEGLRNELNRNLTNPTPNRRAQKRYSSPALPAEMAERIERQNKSFEKMIGHEQRPEFGSNAWAISKDATASGGSLLAGDGHLPLSVPSLFYQMCLDTAHLGNSDFKVCGLFFPGLPLMSVGTNSFVAWSQTYLNGDITDWYQEEILLNADGEPSQSKFQGEWKDLQAIEETYQIRNPATGAVTQERWKRWMTFDGRWLTGIEGPTVDSNTTAPSGQTIVNMLGDAILPSDANEDGIIHGLSFDWTAFDITATLDAVENFSYVKNVNEFRAQTKKLIAYAQNIIVADRNGDILYTPYNAIPCRSYLAKDENKQWVSGANPMRLLDGTQYGAFEIPVRGDNTVETASQDDYRCAIPFDDIPQALSPKRGYVYTANNDIGGVSLDQSLSNDPWYFAGPFAVGYRAHLIESHLEEVTEQKNATMQNMAELQNLHTSPLAQELSPQLLGAVNRAANLQNTSRQLTEAETRLLSIYISEQDAISEATERIEAWVSNGALAQSGVDTFYNTVTPTEADNAVATMVFNSWVRHLFWLLFDDEDIDFLWDADGDRIRMRAFHAVLTSSGADNPNNLASWNPQTEESAFIDIHDTPVIETLDEIIVQALTNTLADLRSEPVQRGIGGFGSSDMSQWLWGLRHQVQFNSLIAQLGDNNLILGLLGSEFSTTTRTLPLAQNISEEDPRGQLSFFPRPGDFFGVDAAHAPLDADHYFHKNGPVMRMVFELTPEKVTGKNIIPGGQSGYKDAPHAVDQVKKWLANETLPIHFYTPDAVNAAHSRELFTP